LNDEQDQQRNPNAVHRPSQLQTKQTSASSTNNSTSSALGHANQEDNSPSHDTTHSM